MDPPLRSCIRRFCSVHLRRRGFRPVSLRVLICACFPSIFQFVADEDEQTDGDEIRTNEPRVALPRKFRHLGDRTGAANDPEPTRTSLLSSHLSSSHSVVCSRMAWPWTFHTGRDLASIDVGEVNRCESASKASWTTHGRRRNTGSRRSSCWKSCCWRRFRSVDVRTTDEQEEGGWSCGKAGDSQGRSQTLPAGAFTRAC